MFTNFYGKEYHLQKISYTTQQILHKKMAFFSGHGGFKKTKESRTRGKLSFWGVQKDKRELESEQTVLLEVSKRQKRNARATSCLSPGPGKKNKKQTAPF
ncbi:hypothetical protein [Heyndrickxia faecalis]|uniref:hypothetical protein n=1 Tax=Heyndrickxia faecalis TaxID=2824910 RepID=UPI003D6B06B4